MGGDGLAASTGGAEETELLEKTQGVKDRKTDPGMEKGEKGTQRDKGHLREIDEEKQIHGKGGPQIVMIKKISS